MLGEDHWKDVQERYLHTLGNLTLTGYNSELGDLPFADKKQKIKERQSKIKTLYADVEDAVTWDADAIKKRADNLIKIILMLYPIEQPQESISFADPRYQEYSCEDPDTATFKTPNYYVLHGERINVSSFAEMLRSIVRKLYQHDSTIIENMAKTKDPILSWSQFVMFSYEVNDVYGDHKIDGTDIYESAGFSASHVMYIVRALLDKYGIDRSDFIYSARSNKTAANVSGKS